MKKKKMLCAALAAVLALGTAGTLPQKGGLTMVAAADTAIGGEWLYEENADGGITITKYSGSNTAVEIPDKINDKPVTVIGAKAFFECRLIESIAIPDSVTIIEDNAFTGCERLTSVTIPQNVTSIGDHVFLGTSSLESIDVEAGNNYYTSEGGVLFNADKTTLVYYPAGKSGSAYTIPDTVIEILDNAFSMSHLEEITISSGVEKLGQRAFGECINLSQFVLNNTNFILENGVLFDKTKTTLIHYPAKKADTSYTVPDGVTKISWTAFQFCGVLTSITIPDSVTYIDCGAFEYCSALSEVNIPDGVAIIQLLTFGYCSNLTNIVIPEGVTSIGDSAFSNCTSLNSVTIPKSVTQIDIDAFEECTELENVIYGGTEEEWSAIDIGTGNECLKNAMITFSDATTKVPEPGEESEPKVFDEPVIAGEESLDEETKAILKNIEVHDDNGAFGNDVTMNITAKESTDNSFSFDITFTDKDGEEVQPKSKVTVYVPIPENLKGLDKIYVYHYNKQGILKLVESRIENGYVIFEAESFSEYVLSANELDTGSDSGAGTGPATNPNLTPNPNPNPGSDTDSGTDTDTSSENSSDTIPDSSTDTSSDNAPVIGADDTSKPETSAHGNANNSNPSTGIGYAFVPVLIAAGAVIASVKKRK